MYNLIQVVLTCLIVAVISAFLGVKINIYRNKKKCIECLMDMAVKLRECKEFETFDVYDTWCGKIAK